jgi:hypothetical protein
LLGASENLTLGFRSNAFEDSVERANDMGLDVDALVMVDVEGVDVRFDVGVKVNCVEELDDIDEEFSCASVEAELVVLDTFIID